MLNGKLNLARLNQSIARTMQGAVRPLSVPVLLAPMDPQLADHSASQPNDAVEHPNRVKYQLLSPESIDQIAAIKLTSTKARSGKPQVRKRAVV